MVETLNKTDFKKKELSERIISFRLNTTENEKLEKLLKFYDLNKTDFFKNIIESSYKAVIENN